MQPFLETPGTQVQIMMTRRFKTNVSTVALRVGIRDIFYTYLNVGNVQKQLLTLLVIHHSKVKLNRVKRNSFYTM